MAFPDLDVANSVADSLLHMARQRFEEEQLKTTDPEEIKELMPTVLHLFEALREAFTGE